MHEPSHLFHRLALLPRPLIPTPPHRDTPADMARRAGSRRIAGLSADNTPDHATPSAIALGTAPPARDSVGAATSEGNVGEDVAAEALELYREALDGYSLVLAAAATSPMTDKWAQWASLAHYGRAVIFHWLEDHDEVM